jgi:hypothetical protein
LAFGLPEETWRESILGMPIPMHPEAIRCFRILNELSFMLEVIDFEVYEERLRYLAELLADPSGGVSGSGAPGDDGSGESLAAGSGGTVGTDAAHQELLDSLAGETPPDWLRFIPAGPLSHLSRWHFIKGDPDPHPSVPHGHDQGRSFPKLDPYLGWIHVSTTRTGGRLSKDDTRALWSDRRFRDFASAALVHFAQENPNYVWRVPRPLRLPRLR